MRNRKSGFTQIYYGGKPISIRPDMADGEIWFVNDNNFVIKKIRDTQVLSAWELLMIKIKTRVSEWLGWGSKKGYGWHQTAGFTPEFKGSLNLKKMKSLYTKANKK